MSKRVSKLISLLLALSLLMGLSVSASAEMDSRVRTRVEGVGLMEGYEDGSFGEADELTRAQMCMIAARILQVETVGFGASPFADVSEDHWAKDVIATLSQAGVVNGMGDGTFLPDKSVSYFEAAKILVSVLGYSDFADNMGGYPNGYLAQASKLGLLKGITASNSAISRGEVAQMLDRALDVKPIGYNFMQNYPDAVYTLQEILSDSKDLVQFKGTLTETAKSSLAAIEPSLKEGVVLVAGQKLLCDMPMEDFLGCELIVYAYLDDEVDKYRIKSFTPTKNNVIYEADAENVEWNGDKAVLFDDEGDELEELTLADGAKLITLYNGRKADVAAEARGVIYGGYRFLDSNDDGTIDVLFIEEAQSFVIDRVNVKTSTVYFKDRLTLDGRNAVSLDAEKEDKVISLTDAEGKALTVEELQEDWAITLFASKDQKYVRAIVSSETVAGKVTVKSVEGIQIDDTFYELAKKPDGTANITPTIGEEASYILDCYGKVAGSSEAVQTSYQYVYIIDAKTGSGLNSGLSIQTVSGQKPQKEVKVSAGEETISYYFQNDPVKVYDCADKCAAYEYSYNFDTLSYDIGPKQDIDDLTIGEIKGKMAALRLNGEGKVREMYLIPTERISSGYAFNANILSFGGEVATGRGYATDQNTMFICLPETPDSLDDYYVQVKLTDNVSSKKVMGAVFFPDSGYESIIAEPVDIMLIQDDMDASADALVSDDICIVGEVIHTIDEAGEPVYAVEMLDNGQELTLSVKNGTKAESVAETLRKGDLISYAKDGSGKMINIEKKVSVQGLGDSYSKDIPSNFNCDVMYGMAFHTVHYEYDFKNNQMVDWITLVFSDNESDISQAFRLCYEDQPTIYKYERKSGWISECAIEDTEDIRTYKQVGVDADKVLAVVDENDIKALVIITDY